MACNVCLPEADYDGNAFDFAHRRHARRAYVCCECRAAIALGAAYMNEGGKSLDGEFFSYKTCATCHEIRVTFSCGGSWLFGELWEGMCEYAFGDLTTASPCFTELTPAAKAVVMDRWRAWKGLP